MPIIDELKADLATAESNAKAWVRGELPDFANDAEDAVAKVAAAGQAALDTAATAYTPTFAPAAIPIINDLVAGAVTVWLWGWVVRVGAVAGAVCDELPLPPPPQANKPKRTIPHAQIQPREGQNWFMVNLLSFPNPCNKMNNYL